MVIKLIKSFFKKEIPTEEIYFSDIDSWINSKSKKIWILAENELKEKNLELNEETSKIKEAMKILEIAELKNKKIEHRHIQIMEGNRDAYIKKITLFLNALNKPQNIDMLPEFFLEFQKNLDQLTSHTAKSYFVLQEFFGKESSDVAMKIKKLDLISKEINNITVSNQLGLLNEINNNLNNYHEAKKIKLVIKGRIKEIKNEIEKINSQKKEYQEKLSIILKSKEYNEFQNNIILKDDYSRKTKMIHNNLIQKFIILDRPLRKYERITLDTEIINGLIQDPVKLIINETQKTLQALQNLKEALEKDSIEVKPIIKEKAIALISSLSFDYFSNFRNDCQEIEKCVNEIEKKINNSDINIKIDEIKSHISKKENDLAIMNSELKSLENKAEVDLSKKIIEIEQKINQLKDVKIKIVR